MIEHVLSHLVSRKIERGVDRWVQAGRNNAPIADGERCVLQFGRRHRVQSVLAAALFVVVCAFGAWCHVFLAPFDFWLVLAYVGFVFPVCLLTVGCAAHDLTLRVWLTRTGLVLQRFGLTVAEIKWDDVTSVRRSPIRPSIIIDTHSGRRVRVSTQLDGLDALAELLSATPPPSRDRSIVTWMIEEL